MRPSGVIRTTIPATTATMQRATVPCRPERPRSLRTASATRPATPAPWAATRTRAAVPAPTEAASCRCRTVRTPTAYCTDIRLTPDSRIVTMEGARSSRSRTASRAESGAGGSPGAAEGRTPWTTRAARTGLTAGAGIRP
ncbi:hypothetical protein SMD44_07554 [Streptomyces alboflavus]|uniref:Uncharacterized protein n=1 Tax=Streptomyces alboflavus TaxID=67267 RepID=A0A1Z1WNN9_9ACTN|nr:hypothetical protein SMD44_07554 [Streptomyces alboflavus]